MKWKRNQSAEAIGGRLDEDEGATTLAADDDLVASLREQAKALRADQQASPPAGDPAPPTPTTPQTPSTVTSPKASPPVVRTRRPPAPEETRRRTERVVNLTDTTHATGATAKPAANPQPAATPAPPPTAAQPRPSIAVGKAAPAAANYWEPGTTRTASISTTRSSRRRWPFAAIAIALIALILLGLGAVYFFATTGGLAP